jgi:glutaredoxin
MGRILLYTTAGCSLCAAARSIVRAWGSVFYEISLAEHPGASAELCELTGRDYAVVPQLFLNETIYEVRRCGRWSPF